MYPEHDKLEYIKKESQKLGKFLEWCRYNDDYLYYTPIDKVLAVYFGIDLDKIEEEKQQMLKEMQNKTIKIEMEIPVPPEGYEYTGEYRRPKIGEYFLEGDTAGTCENSNYDDYPILRPAWKWPEWLKGWGIVKNVTGTYWLFEHEAYYTDNDGWLPVRGEGNSVSLQGFTFKRFSNLTLPVITNHLKPVLNPNYKKTEDET